MRKETIRTKWFYVWLGLTAGVVSGGKPTGAADMESLVKTATSEAAKPGGEKGGEFTIEDGQVAAGEKDRREIEKLAEDAMKDLKGFVNKENMKDVNDYTFKWTHNSAMDKQDILLTTDPTSETKGTYQTRFSSLNDQCRKDMQKAEAKAEVFNRIIDCLKFQGDPYFKELRCKGEKMIDAGVKKEINQKIQEWYEKWRALELQRTDITQGERAALTPYNMTSSMTMVEHLKNNDLTNVYKTSIEEFIKSLEERADSAIEYIKVFIELYYDLLDTKGQTILNPDQKDQFNECFKSLAKEWNQHANWCNKAGMSVWSTFWGFTMSDALVEMMKTIKGSLEGFPQPTGGSKDKGGGKEMDETERVCEELRQLVKETRAKLARKLYTYGMYLNVLINGDAARLSLQKAAGRIEGLDFQIIKTVGLEKENEKYASRKEKAMSILKEQAEGTGNENVSTYFDKI